MARLLIGMLKGALVAVATLLGFDLVGMASTMMAYLAAGATGALVGLVAGKPPWKAETLWTPLIKMVTGSVVGVAICAAIVNILPNVNFLSFASAGSALMLHSALVIVPVVALLYGAFVEADDAA